MKDWDDDEDSFPAAQVASSPAATKDASAKAFYDLQHVAEQKQTQPVSSSIYLMTSPSERRDMTTYSHSSQAMGGIRPSSTPPSERSIHALQAASPPVNLTISAKAEKTISQNDYTLRARRSWDMANYTHELRRMVLSSTPPSEGPGYTAAAGDRPAGRCTPQAVEAKGGRRRKGPRKRHSSSKRASSPMKPSSDADIFDPRFSHGNSGMHHTLSPFFWPQEYMGPAVQADLPVLDNSNGRARSSSQDSPGTSHAFADPPRLTDSITSASFREPPLSPKDVSLTFEYGDLVIEWTTNYQHKCLYNVMVYNSRDELIFEERTMKMQHRIPKDELDPIMQYYATVSAQNIDGGTESKIAETKKAAMYKRLGESNVYADKSSPLKKGYHVYAGFMESPCKVREEVAVKFVEGRYLREIETLVGLGSMENVVTYKCSGEIGEDFAAKAFIVMELCHEDNLYDMVEKGLMKDQPDEVKKVLVHIMRGLSHIHDKNILHRDLKPHNVLRSKDKKSMKICDFGVSKQMRGDRSRVSKSSADIGTEGWGSPEHYGGSKCMSIKSDIFSAGLIFCYVLSGGSHACGGKEKAYRWKIHIIDNEPICLPEFKCDEPALAAELVSKMLQYDPDDRPNSSEVLSHPFFWKNERKLNFISSVSSFVQGMLKRQISNVVATLISNDLTSMELDFSGWGKKILDTPGPDYLCKMVRGEIPRAGKYKYNPDSLVHLIRFIRNVSHHYSDNHETLQSFKNRAEIWPFFSNLFPNLLAKVFSVFGQHVANMEEIFKLSDIQDILTQKVEYDLLKKF